MHATLRREEFSEEKLAEVQSFDCGSQPWHTEVSDWIKGGPSDLSALRCMKRRGTKVWLYRDCAGRLVGFGSLGKSKWSLPDPTTVSIIPNVAVALEFQGEPATGPKEHKYCRQIMSHLIDEAKRNRTPYLALFVAPQNEKARRFYEKVGFQYLDDPNEPKEHLRMVLDLS